MTTWTPANEVSTTWSEENTPTRVFDPKVFALAPVFDTGSPAGLWAISSKQIEVWTPK